MPNATPILSLTNGQAVAALRRIAAQIIELDGCWLWTGPTCKGGYGRFKINKRATGAHRASWLAHRSDIPEGLQVDHLCRNRTCVNPWHMDLVTPGVNTRRSPIYERGEWGRPRKSATRPRNRTP